MTAPAKRAVVVGMDGASMEIVRLMAEEGHAPNIAELMSQGVWRPMIGVFPTLTPPGWTALSTGSWPGTHGVMDFNIHVPGQPLDQTEWGINTGLCRSEYIWNTFERAGKTPILVKWEMSWPPTVTTGIQVEGTGPGVSNHHQIAGYHLFVGGKWAARELVSQRDPESLDPSALQGGLDYDPVSIEDAVDWKNPPTSTKPLREVRLVIKPLARGRETMLRGKAGDDRVYWALLLASAGNGYDRVRICRSRDGNDSVCELTVGQWSDWFVESFVIDGTAIEGYVQIKLVTLSPEADVLEIFLPQIWPRGGYTRPEEIAGEIDQNVGNFLQNPARDALGRVDDQTYFELLEFHHQRLADVALYLAGTRSWDLLMVESHASDYTSHFFLGQVDKTSGASPDVLERSRQGVIRTYQSLDRMIGRLRDLADSETVFLVVSDHGGTSVQHPAVNINQVLEEAGFLVYHDQKKEQIDWGRTRAYGIGLVHVFLNVAGRDPDGIIDPDEYEKVRRELIEALTCYRDEATGELPFSLVISREDAEMVNLRGDRVGDVVYALRPEFDGAHGKQLPSVSFGIGGQHSTFIMAGAGVASRGRLERQVRVVDVAPTICHLTGAPMPRDVEGGVVYEALAEGEQ